MNSCLLRALVATALAAIANTPIFDAATFSNFAKLPNNSLLQNEFFGDSGDRGLSWDIPIVR